jgi:hypothetical protein
VATDKSAPSIYQLKITLTGIDPPIWRQLEVPSSIKLCCLHTAFQVVMGWTDSHLHQFEKDGKKWGVVQLHQDEEDNVLDEGGVTVAEVLKAEGDSLRYEYDFGDCWWHEVFLEKIVPVNDAAKVPICFGGERRCPVEDVGGVQGYEHFLEVILDPKAEQYSQFVRWAGGHFIDELDLKAVNHKLSRMKWPVKHKR